MRKSDSPHKTTEKLDATKPRRYCRRYRGEGGRRESGYEKSACESHLGSLALFFSTYLGNAQWAFPARPGHHHSKYPVLRLPRGSERAAEPRPEAVHGSMSPKIEITNPSAWRAIRGDRESAISPKAQPASARLCAPRPEENSWKTAWREALHRWPRIAASQAHRHHIPRQI